MLDWSCSNKELSLLLGGPDAWWEHELRDGLRVSQWAACARKRQDMEGLEATQGLDRHATMALHNKSNPVDAGILRGILSGSLRMQQRLFVARLVDNPLCPFCGQADESVEHCFWECPHWSHLRRGCDDLNAAPIARVLRRLPCLSRDF